MGNGNDDNAGRKRRPQRLPARERAEMLSLSPVDAEEYQWQVNAAAAEAVREINDEIAARLAALEAADPSQQRPKPRHAPNHHRTCALRR